MSGQPQWWGILEPEHSAQAVADRAAAAGMACFGDAGDGFTLRWSATEDLNDAIAVLHESAGVDPGHFRRGPERV